MTRGVRQPTRDRDGPDRPEGPDGSRPGSLWTGAWRVPAASRAMRDGPKDQEPRPGLRGRTARMQIAQCRWRSAGRTGADSAQG